MTSVALPNRLTLNLPASSLAALFPRPGSSWRERFLLCVLNAISWLMLAVVRAISVTTPGSPADQIDWENMQTYVEKNVPHPPEGPLRAAVYTRRSIVLEENSLEIQKDQASRFLKRHNWKLVRFYEDDAFSGASHKRPALRQLQHDIKASLIDVVVVDRIDRLYRNLLGLLRFVQLLRDNNVALVSISEGVDFQTPWGMLVLYVLGGLAEYYLAALSRETRKGKRMRAKQGLDNAAFRLGYCNGLCSRCTDPNGFDYCPLFDENDRGNGRVKVPHPVESVAVHLIFLLYSMFDFSLADIATYLNDHTFRREGDYLVCLDHGQPVRRFNISFEDLFALDGEDLSGLLEGEVLRFRTKGVPGLHAPGLFDADAIRTIIHNRFYTGQTTYAGSTNNGSKRRKPVEWFEGNHKALVSHPLFQYCQRKSRQRGNSPQNRRQANRIYPLSHLLHCAVHRERTFRALPSGGYRYYESKLCATKGTLTDRHHTIIPADQIEAEVIAFAGQLRLPDAWRDHILAYLVDDDGLQGLLHKRWQVYERMGRAQKLYLDEVNPISQEDYDRIMNECKDKLEKLQPDRIPQCAEALPYIEDLSKLLTQATWAEQNRLLRSIIAAVYIDPISGQAVEFKVYPVFKPYLPQEFQITTE